MPTVISSWLKSSWRPMSIWMAATSSEDENATTTYIATHVGSADGSSSHLRRDAEGRERGRAAGLLGEGGARISRAISRNLAQSRAISRHLAASLA